MDPEILHLSVFLLQGRVVAVGSLCSVFAVVFVVVVFVVVVSVVVVFWGKFGRLRPFMTTYSTSLTLA